MQNSSVHDSRTNLGGTGPGEAKADLGGRRKLDPHKRREIAESVLSGRKSGAIWQGSTTSANRLFLEL